MRLLSVIHGPTFGGAHNQAVELSGPLREAGVETLVVLPVEAEQAAERIRQAGVQVFLLELGRLRATLRPRDHLRLVAGLWPEVTSLRALIREQKIDVVQTHGPANPHAALAAHREGAGLVWQLLDTRLPMPLRRLFMPFVTWLADVITAWGEAVARAHPGAIRVGDRLVVVFPPVPPDLAPSESGRDAARRRLAVETSDPVVGTLGVLTPQKGQDEMLLAAEQLLDRMPQPAVRLIGSSSPAHPTYERNLRRLADRIDPEGARIRIVEPGADARGLLQGIDVLAMTSVPRSEGMPTAILEAMALGKPVVATDVGSTAELVDDGVTGLLVEPGRPEAVAAAIGKVLADGDLRERMGRAGRERARAEFSLERLTALHLGAYRRAARAASLG